MKYDPVTVTVIASALVKARYPDGFVPGIGAPGTEDEIRRFAWLVRHLAEAIAADHAGLPAPPPRPDWPDQADARRLVRQALFD